MHRGRGSSCRGVVRIAVPALRNSDRFGGATGSDDAHDHPRYHAPRDDRPDGVSERFTERFAVCFFDGVSVPLTVTSGPGSRGDRARLPSEQPPPGVSLLRLSARPRSVEIGLQFFGPLFLPARGFAHGELFDLRGLQTSLPPRRDAPRSPRACPPSPRRARIHPEEQPGQSLRVAARRSRRRRWSAVLPGRHAPRWPGLATVPAPPPRAPAHARLPVPRREASGVHAPGRSRVRAPSRALCSNRPLVPWGIGTLTLLIPCLMLPFRYRTFASLLPTEGKVWCNRRPISLIFPFHHSKRAPDSSRTRAVGSDRPATGINS
jgi:hypothetical protein